MMARKRKEGRIAVGAGVGAGVGMGGSVPPVSKKL
jgi:hypothetical protein